MPIRMPVTLKTTSLALALGLTSVSPVSSKGLAGAYLAARHASAYSDFSASAQYFTRTLAFDHSNPTLLENTLLSFVGLGQIDKGASIARKMQSDGLKSQLANMAVIVDLIKKKGFEQVIKRIDSGQTIGPLIDRLVVAWAKVGANDPKGALADFDTIIDQRSAKDIGRYNKAIALASLKRFNDADAIFSAKGADGFQTSIQSAVAHAQILSQLGRNQDAIKMLDAVFSSVNNPLIQKIRTELEKGDKLEFSAANTARKGIAEVFFTIANALNGEAADTNTLIYGRMAQDLDPTHVQAILLTADLLESLGQFDLAIAAFNNVPRDHPYSYLAELGRAKTLRVSGKTEASIEALSALTKSFPEKSSVFSSLGDALRADSQYKLAAQAYTNAIELVPNPAAKDWFLYYARGISFERTDEWAKAEADFRQAMNLNPDQPQVLNYLGYSMLEKKINLDEALSLIENAVSLQPNSGYITDSLGWAYYLLKRYDEAVPVMLKAAKLMPVDPVVSDHFGDTLWAVGRKREARFQWRRAMSFDPDEKDAERIRQKLKIGLDAVLINEGQDATPVAANDG